MSFRYAISNFFRRNGGTILTCLSSIGVIGTAYLTGKAAIKADKELKTLGEEAPLKEKIRVAAPIYILPAAVGTATIACMFGANGLNRKQQASMLAAGALLEQTYQKYKDKAEELLGKNVVEKNMADEVPPELNKDERLFYYNYYEDGDHPEYGSYFNCTIEDLLKAEIETQRQFILCGYVTLNFFFDKLGLKPVEGGDNLGWSAELGHEYYGYSWVDFEHFDTTLEDGLECTIITTPFNPAILA
jgi:hypothetical protein